MIDDDAPDLPPEEEEPTAPFWMATYSDMVTLLLAFFVMIVAMSEVEVQKFEEAISYFPGRSGMLEDEGLAETVETAEGVAERKVAELAESVAEAAVEMGLDGVVGVEIDERGVVVTLPDSVTFAPGSAELLPPADAILARLADTARGRFQSLLVEGHTDNVPIETVRYPSNWELSGARAARVVRFFLERPGALPPDRYIAVGFAEHRPRAPNATAKGRAQNRRVTIVLRTATPPSDPTLPF